MHCQKCGALNTDQAKFCGKCGQGIEISKEKHEMAIPIDKKAFAKPPKSVLKYALVPIGMLFAWVALWGVMGYMQAGSTTNSTLFDVFNLIIPLILSFTVLAIFIAPLYAVYSNSKNFDGTIKCGNCEYVGPGEPARKLGFNILAWLCVFIVPLVTIIYFLATHKYRCPKCKSTFLGMRTRDGVFVGQGGGGGSGVVIIILVIFFIVIIGILSSVVLASLSTARQKSRDAAVISNLTQLQLGAELYYAQNNNTYSNAENCESGMFISADVQSIIARLTPNSVRCFAAGDSYSISANLEREDKSYCVDLNGGHGGSLAGIVEGAAKCSASEGGALSGSWQEYNSIVGSFSALFPFFPTHETTHEPVDGSEVSLTTEIYSSIDNDSAYFVAYIDYPTSFEIATPAANALEGVINAMVSTSPSNKLVTSMSTTMLGYPAASFTIFNSKENIYLKGNAILKYRELYLVYYAYPSDQYNTENYSKFMNSFDIK